MVNPIKNAFWFIVFRVMICVLWYTYYLEESDGFSIISIGIIGLTKEDMEQKYYCCSCQYGIEYKHVILFLMKNPYPKSIYSKIRMFFWKLPHPQNIQNSQNQQ